MNYSKMLEDKFAVVTCGDTGIGAAIIGLFAEHGATVAFGAKNTETARNLLAAISKKSPASFFIPCDLAAAESIETFCAEINQRAPLVNILVNNPWTEFNKPFDDSNEDDDELMLQVYQRSIMQTLRAFWTEMLKKEGCSVINISSYSVFKPVQGMLMRTMANGAAGGMTRVPAVEGGFREVRVNEIQVVEEAGICPGFANSAHTHANTAGSATNILGGTTDIASSVANTALYLASEMASYTSGITISVSGGLRRMR